MTHSLNKHFALFLTLGAIITLLTSVIAIIAGEQAASASTAIWLPAFKLLGITLFLSGVVMAQDMLCLQLSAIRPKVASLVAPCMTLSLALVTAGFILSLYLAGVVSGTAIDLEATSSIQTLKAASSASYWLEGLQLTSMAMMLLAVAGSLYTLFQLFRHQQTNIGKKLADQVFRPTSLTDRPLKNQ